MVSANLYSVDGSSIRFGPDEADAGDVPLSASFGTEVPGWGYAEGSIELARPENLTALDAALFSHVRFLDCDNRTCYEGRVVGTPRVGSDVVSIDLEGWAAHLDDDETARMIFRDIDLSAWGEAPGNRTVAQRQAGYLLDGSVATGWDTATGKQTITCAFDRMANSSAALTRLASEPYYDAKGVQLESCYYNLACNTAMALGGATWVNALYAMTKDAGSSISSVSMGGAGGSGTLSIGVGAVAMLIDCYYNATFTGDGSWAAMWRDLAVYGRHGIAKRGAEPAVGFTYDDVVKYAVKRWAPLLNVAAGAVEPGAFLIPHLKFTDDSTARQMVEAATLFGAGGNAPPDYGVYEDRGFFAKTPGTYGRRWHVRRSDAALPSDDGASAEDRVTGFKIAYVDGGGVDRTVGPPGSGSDFETSLLLDTSVTNPVVSSGLGVRFKSESVGITNAAGAILIGRLLMAEANADLHKGSFQATGTVRDIYGGEADASQVRGGDTVVIEDDEDTTERRIVSTSWEADTVSANLDAPPHRVETLLAQFASASNQLGLF